MLTAYMNRNKPIVVNEYKEFIDTTNMDLSDMLTILNSLNKHQAVIYHIGLCLADSLTPTVDLKNKAYYLRKRSDYYRLHVRRVSPGLYEYIASLRLPN